MLNSLSSTAFWFQVLASTTPVLLATISANIMTQSGIFNLGIEGTMLICALIGVLGSAFSQSLMVGMICGIVAGVFISFVLGYFALILKGPMNACGVAINLLATGGTVFVLTTLTGSKVTSSSLSSLTFPVIRLPPLERIPVIGEVFSGHNLITYISWIFVVLTWIFLYRTKLGRNLRAVGENQEAARSAGISVNGMKFFAMGLCGLYCAFGGMYLSMGSLKSFTAGMTAGRGYLALALDSMSRGNPLLGFASSLLYGFSVSTTVYLQMYSDLDIKLISALPYVFIIMVLFVVQMTKRILNKRRLRVLPERAKYKSEGF
jgi:simple sugar transport system permease protein